MILFWCYCNEILFQPSATKLITCAIPSDQNADKPNKKKGEFPPFTTRLLCHGYLRFLLLGCLLLGVILLLGFLAQVSSLGFLLLSGFFSWVSYYCISSLRFLLLSSFFFSSVSSLPFRFYCIWYFAYDVYHHHYCYIRSCIDFHLYTDVELNINWLLLP